MAQIAAYPSGSPARVMLELWQAVQFSDVEGARRLVEPAALGRLKPGQFASMVQTIGDDVPGLRILSTAQSRITASVRVYLVFYASNRSVTSTSPLSFALRRGPNGYRLSDLSYFTRTEQAILAARHRASHK